MKGTVYLQSGKYRVRFRYTTKDGRRISLVYTLESAGKVGARAEADRIAKTLGATVDDEVDKLRGRLERLASEKQENHSGHGLNEAWDAYLSSQERPASGPRTLRDYAGYWSAFVRFVGTGRTLESVTREEANKYARHLDGSGMSRATVSKHLKVLRMVFRVLCPGLENPFGRVRSMLSGASAAVVKHEPFTRDMIRRVLLALPWADSEENAFVWLLAFSGVRAGDAAGFRVEWVSGDMVSFYPSKTGGRGGAPLACRFAVHPSLAPVIENYRAGRVSGFLFPGLADEYRRNPSGVVRRFQRVLFDLGIVSSGQPPTGRRRSVYGFHSFRFSVQAELDRAGVPGVVADVMLCHKRPGMGAYYGERGVTDDQLMAAAFALPAAPLPSGGALLKFAC